MRILIVNVVCGIRSTGRICTDLAMKLEKEGNEVKIAYGRGKVPEMYSKYAVRIGNSMEQINHALRTRVLDEHGFGSKKGTREFLQWAEDFDPDLLWLHNIHGYYINVEMLFQWIKSRKEMQVKWTLHDCWAFTGHCSHFCTVDCEQWRDQCNICRQKTAYPASIFRDNCEQNFARKNRAFTGVHNMTIITPSQWLADLVKQSFLREYPVEVHYNSVDKNIFKPTPSDFRERYNLKEKKIILGVASTWSKKKGLDDFITLKKMLDDSYTIVLVGVDRKQERKIKRNSTNSDVDLLPCTSSADKYVRTSKGVAVPADVRNIYEEITGREYNGEQQNGARLLCIERTDSAKKLAEIYTSADYFVNPTHEDTFPTVNLEAIACGTFVITYMTGGCVETLSDLNILEKII